MKMSVRNVLMSATVLVMGLMSCEKELNDRSCDTPSKVEYGEDSNYVNVRVINFTGYPLCDFQIQYRKDEGTFYEYGTLDVGETTPYTTVAFTHVYPEITFNLGTGSFTIPDTLLKDKYSLQKQASRGYYSYIIQTVSPLEEEKTISYMVTETNQ